MSKEYSMEQVVEDYRREYPHMVISSNPIDIKDELHFQNWCSSKLKVMTATRPLLNDKERVEKIREAMKLINEVDENTLAEVNEEAKSQAAVCLKELNKFLSYYKYS